MDIFAIQDEVCLSIAARLRVTLLEDEKARLVRHLTHDADAYTLYLKARFLFNKRQEASLQKSLRSTIRPSRPTHGSRWPTPA